MRLEDQSSPAQEKVQVQGLVKEKRPWAGLAGPLWGPGPGRLGALPLLPCSQRWTDRTGRPLRSQEWHPWVLQPGDLWPDSFNILFSYFVPGLTTPKAPSLIIQYFLQTLLRTDIHQSILNKAIRCLGGDSRAQGLDIRSSHSEQWGKLPVETRFWSQLWHEFPG